MKTLFHGVCMFVLCLVMPAIALAFSATESKNAEFGLNRAAPEAMQKYQLGTKVMRDTMHDLMVSWSFADQGGAVTTVNLHTPKSNSPLLPKNAIVVGCYLDVLTTPTGGGTIAFSTGKSAADLLTATTATTLTGIVACVPTGTAATAIKLTADVTPTMTVASTAVTAGKINVHILYLLSDYP